VTLKRPCPACDGRRLEPVAAVQPEHLLRCSSCGLVFESRTPTEQQLAAHYSQYSYGRLKPCPPATQASYRQVLQTLRPWRGQGRLLDLGCGQGDFLAEAAAAHWQPTGMEYSQAAVSLCTQRGLDVVQGASAASALAGRRFDVVTAFEVLEHLRTPGALLRDAASLLEPGGLMYLTTPNFNALLRHLEHDRFAPVSYPDHLCFFTPASLRRLAARHGFHVAALRTTGLDPWRLRQSLIPGPPPQATDPLVPSSGADPRNDLRAAVYTRRRVALLKAAVNAMVNVVGAGDTLKAWLVKV
jgi:2-polyprenyl-3-methyl-5-hydroxy-6-metoxy-1,4-benzoquinol methylase